MTVEAVKSGILLIDTHQYIMSSARPMLRTIDILHKVPFAQQTTHENRHQATMAAAIRNIKTTITIY